MTDVDGRLRDCAPLGNCSAAQPNGRPTVLPRARWAVLLGCCWAVASGCLPAVLLDCCWAALPGSVRAKHTAKGTSDNGRAEGSRPQPAERWSGCGRALGAAWQKVGPGLEPATFGFQVHRLNHSATWPS